MDEENHKKYISALVELHRGLPRQGPGDRQFTFNLLRNLPSIPDKPTIADLGCGSGIASLQLAEFYQSHVKAVDLSHVFIDELKNRLFNSPLEQFIEPICADMATLDWPNGSIDLLWSEGAAYNLGFKKALDTWRPLLKNGGFAVISEMTWFADAVPEKVRSFWQSEYPGMSTENQNLNSAKDVGYDEVFTERLPANAWWKNYYQPLQARISEIETLDVMPQVIHDIQREMQLFADYSDYYGYTFYVLKTSSRSS